MRLSFNWLADFVDLSGLTPELVAEKLTMRAFEVESIHPYGADLTGPIVVGQIVDIQAHPDPKVSKMRLTKVKVDDKQDVLEIVCGAANIAVGQRVPVALPGSIVINRHDGTPFPIAIVEKRGVRSSGMICAPSELGIESIDEAGILVLDPKLANLLGADIQKLLCLSKDYVLTVGSRSNRGDAVCVRGMAREVAALFQRPLREPEWQIDAQAATAGKTFTVEIDDLKDCEYFSIRAISKIKIAPSPAFMVRRLGAVGTRSINNLVDITNYVMHEWGQPLHAYDARHVKDGKFRVRRGHNGEKFATLDGKERTLTEEMLIISDTEKVIGMPVMGGANSEVVDATTDIALEAASFTPVRVRRTSRLLGLSSESGLRFERGIDAATTKQASDRATYLISKYCAGDTPVQVGTFIAGGIAERPPLHIDLRLSEIKRHLNLDLPPAQIIELLNPLGFSPVENGNGKGAAEKKLVMSVPTFRQDDVQREIDLIEEICRIYGYDNIPEEPPTFLALSKMPESISTKVRQSLIAQGLSEAYINSLTVEDGEMQNPAHTIKMLNPLSKDHQVLRHSLLPGLINALKYNWDRSEGNVWLFELARVYFNKQNKIQSNQPVVEETKVAGILTGNRALSLWQEQSGKNASSSNKMDFYIAKGILENLFHSLNIPASQIKYMPSSDSPSLIHPGQAAKIFLAADSQGNQIELGWLGKLHPACAQNFDLDPLTYLFEIDLDALKNMQDKHQFSPIPALSPISRDLTINLPQSIDNIAVSNCIKEAAIHLRDLDLVSIFPLNNEQKSFSYRLTFQSEAETFKNEEIDQILNNIRGQLKEKLSASFRT